MMQAGGPYWTRHPPVLLQRTTAPEIEVSMKKSTTLSVIILLIALGFAVAQEVEETLPPIADLDQLHQFLLKKEKAGEFSGAVLIARDGTPLFENAYGYASKRFDVRNTLDTKFNLGSINKLFTSIAILQLADGGKVSLDDPIGKYLDIFPSHIAEKVTLRQLLDMSSGWGDYWENADFKASQFNLRTVPDYMEFIKDIPLDFEPGTSIQHCNTGFEVAGAVIEKVTGDDYFEYIRSHIYEPLGMKDTDSFHRDGPAKNLATGYTDLTPEGEPGGGYQWSNMYLLSPRGTPAGGGYSTVTDLLEISKALRNNTILSEDYTRIIWNAFRGEPGDPINPLILERMWVSAGGAPGISAILAIGIDSGLTCIVLSNYDFPVALDIFKEIRRMDLDRAN
jgi:D-alanyl-D-alanine carboxypeptidase